MVIPKHKFAHWKSTGADAGSAAARQKILSTLKLPRSPLQNKSVSYTAYLQGSYRNHTHTRGSSDVDVVVELTSTFRKDLSELEPDEKRRYNNDKNPASYSYASFYRDVYKALKLRFSKTSSNPLSQGNKSIKIDSDLTSIISVDVDIIPCIQYRYYRTYPKVGSPDVDKGIYFIPRNSTEPIISYPKIHYENSKDKHQNYRETVRIFKNATRYYNKYYSSFRSVDASSFLIECLIYNIPKRILKISDRSTRFLRVLNFLRADSTDISGFLTVSEMYALFGDDERRTIKTAEQFASRLYNMWINY